jgi:rubredoxin
VASGSKSTFSLTPHDYVYDEATGNPREGFPAGTSWGAVPDDWCCPEQTGQT